MDLNRARVGITADLFGASGEPMFGRAALDILDAAGLAWSILPPDGGVLSDEAVSDFDALFIGASKVTEAVLAADSGRLRLIARNGVGIDAVDVHALTRRGILLTNTPEAVRHGVAAAALGFILALSLRLPLKARLIREGRWRERGDHPGVGLPGRTLGIVGFGGIGRELARLIAPFGMRIVVSDPFATPDTLAGLDVEAMPLDNLIETSDVVVLACNLDVSTYHLIDAERLRRMKPTSFIVNVARGPVVDEAALTEALAAGTIAGAGLDVFETEPPDGAALLFDMDGVIATPHCLCWTDSFVEGVARAGLLGVVDAIGGRAPSHVVNRLALDHPRAVGWLNANGTREFER